MAKNRYIEDYPAIGIRPIIDGRRGPMQLRENLEDQVLAMALAAKKLFEDNLRYSNGDPVKVIIADTTIGRVAIRFAWSLQIARLGAYRNRLPVRRNSAEKAWQLHCLSHRAGATAPKLWIWTR